jgi:hypothetical protein
VYESGHRFAAGVCAPGSNGSTMEGVGSMPTSPEGWSAVAAGLSVIVAVIAGLIAWGQMREARRTRYVDALLTLYDAHQSQESIAARTIIRDKKKNLEALPEPEESMLRAYINQLNFLSSLILDRLVDEKQAKAVFEDAVKNCWRECETTIIQRIRHKDKKEDFAVKLGKVAKAWRQNKDVSKKRKFLWIGH